MAEDIKEIMEEQKLLLDSIDTQIWYLKDEETYGRVNQAFADFVGANKSDIEYKNISEAKNIRKPEICIKENEGVFKKKERIETEEWVENSKGEKRLLSITKTPKLNNKGEVEYVVCSAVDITERKQAEEELEKLLKEYDTIFNSIQASIFLIDVEEEDKIKFQRFNPLAEKLTGLSTEEIKGKTPVEVLGESLGKDIEENYRRCLKKKEKMEYVEKVNLPAGNKIFNTRLNPVIIDGRVEKIVGDSRDITRDRIEKLKTDALFENSNSAIAMLDSEGKIVDINDEFTEAFGYNLPEVKGKHLDDVMERSKAGYSNREKTEEIFRGRKIKGECARYDKEGEHREFLFHGVPIVIEGQVEGAYTLYDDITELRQKENIIKSLHETALELEKLTDIEEVCKSTVEAAENLLQFELCNIALVEDEKLTPKAKTSEEKHKKMTITEGIVGKTYREGEGIIVDDVQNNLETKPVKSSYESAISIPVGDYGVFQAAATEKEAFTEADIELAELLISHTTAALNRIFSQEKLQNRERRYSTIFEKAPIGIMIGDKEGNILRANKALTEITGFEQEELEGSNILDNLVQPEHRELAKENIEKLLQGEDLQFDIKTKAKDGKYLYVQLTETSINLPEGDTGVLSMHQDVTERKEKEEIIKKLHDIALNFKDLDEEKEVCIKTVKVAKELLDFELCIIRLAENKMLIPRAYTAKVNIKPEPRPITEDSISAKTYREGKSILVNNIENKPKTKPLTSTFKSGISIPIGDYGVFQAAATEEEAFTEADLELAELLISHTAATLERIYVQKEIKYKSFHDELTGMYNRRFFEEEKKRFNTKRQLPISIIMADVNGLKIINDSLGHAKGDELLIKTAKILQNALREEDIKARYGGDEFVILLPKTSNKIAHKISLRIKQGCEKTEKDELPLSLGVGIATKNDIEQNIDEVLTKADNNMLQNKLTSSRSAKSKIIESLLNALGAKSEETKEHTQRMIKLAQKLGEKVGLPNSKLDKLSLLANLHDIGKTSIPEEIMTKSGDLTDEEWEIIRNHPQRGYKIALASEEFAVVAEDILAHHERWDGYGYPQGLKGEEIPYLARIITIVDAYDVMISGRPYQQAVSKEEALTEINKCAGSQFDPELAEKFVEMMREDEN